MVKDLKVQLSFLLNTFNGKLLESIEGENGVMQHAEVRIGTVVIMLGRERDDWPARQSMNYVFVDRVGEVFKKAIAQKAKVIMPPGKRSYGMIEAGFEDAFGNQWWIAEQLK